MIPQSEFEKWLEKNLYKEYTYTKPSSFLGRRSQQSGSKNIQMASQSGSKSGSDDRVKRKKTLKIKGL